MNWTKILKILSQLTPQELAEADALIQEGLAYAAKLKAFRDKYPDLFAAFSNLN